MASIRCSAPNREMTKECKRFQLPELPSHRSSPFKVCILLVFRPVRTSHSSDLRDDLIDPLMPSKAYDQKPDLESSDGSQDGAHRSVDSRFCNQHFKGEVWGLEMCNYVRSDFDMIFFSDMPFAFNNEADISEDVLSEIRPPFGPIELSKGRCKNLSRFLRRRKRTTPEALWAHQTSPGVSGWAVAPHALDSLILGLKGWC